jgi:hypothetical protein
MSSPQAGTLGASDHDSITGVCEAGIPLGRAVSQGPLSNKGVVLGGTLAGFRGVSFKDVTLSSSQQDNYVAPNSVGVLQRGQLWVEPGEAVAANDAVHFNTTTGILFKSAGAGRVGPVKGMRFVTSAAVGGRALMYISGYAHVDA